MIDGTTFLKITITDDAKLRERGNIAMRVYLAKFGKLTKLRLEYLFCEKISKFVIALNTYALL